MRGEESVDNSFKRLGYDGLGGIPATGSHSQVSGQPRCVEGGSWERWLKTGKLGEGGQGGEGEQRGGDRISGKRS